MICSTLQAQPAADESAGVKVEVVRTESGWQLLRGGERYFVNGVGGSQNMELLAAVGGNSIRTWGVDENTIKVLDRAHALGLTVTVGIWMEARSQGGDYSNPELREKQLERIRTWVPKLKDHPALLIWGIGNESEVPN
ncbi:MAG TPA: glycoside hydrolase family 2 TIM barrel-domain containing protein, partial [Tepidisphaeraceae bacterium]|nr:glycoside hydrolase family 2 TIM barrel-domain containing protein [Tepidisphaeraceae bacterium]